MSIEGMSPIPEEIRKAAKKTDEEIKRFKESREKPDEADRTLRELIREGKEDEVTELDEVTEPTEKDLLDIKKVAKPPKLPKSKTFAKETQETLAKLSRRHGQENETIDNVLPELNSPETRADLRLQDLRDKQTGKVEFGVQQLTETDIEEADEPDLALYEMRKEQRQQQRQGQAAELRTSKLKELQKAEAEKRASEKRKAEAEARKQEILRKSAESSAIAQQVRLEKIAAARERITNELETERDLDELNSPEEKAYSAGIDAYNKARPERDRLTMEEMAKKQKNRAVSGSTESAKRVRKQEAEEEIRSMRDADLIWGQAKMRDLFGRSEKQDQEWAFLADSRDAAVAQLFSAGIKDADAYAEKLATSRWEQVKHATKMLSPKFSRAWNAFVKADREYQAAIKEANFPDALRIRGARGTRSSDPEKTKWVGDLKI